MKRANNLFFACGIGAAMLFAVGCSKKDPTDLVRQRAVERWDLLSEHHAVKAYDYLSPGYRSTHTLEQYVAFVATARVQWKSAKVDSVQCDDADVCTAKLTVVTVLPGAVIQRPSDMEYPAPVIEKWVHSEGQWYFLPDSKVDGRSIAEQAASIRAPAPAPASAPAPGSVPAATTPPSAPPATESGKEKQK